MRRSAWARPTLICILVYALGRASVAGAQAPVRPSRDAPIPPSLVTFLRAWVSHGEWGDDPDSTTWYAAAPMGRHGVASGTFVVHIVGRYWCGTGGCPTLVVASDSASGAAQGAPAYRLLGDTRITHLPITALPTRSHGWPDLGVWVWGGSTKAAYRARLQYDGRKYEGNASLAPRAGAAGRVLLPEDAPLRPLFPQTPPWQTPRR